MAVGPIKGLSIGQAIKTLANGDSIVVGAGLHGHLYFEREISPTRAKSITLMPPIMRVR